MFSVSADCPGCGNKALCQGDTHGYLHAVSLHMCLGQHRCWWHGHTNTQGRDLVLYTENIVPLGETLNFSQASLGSGLAFDPSCSHVVLVISVFRPGELKFVLLDWL